MSTPTKTSILGDAIFTVHDFCPADECAALIRLADWPTASASPTPRSPPAAALSWRRRSATTPA
jgi:hypothetical protein